MLPMTTTLASTGSAETPEGRNRSIADALKRAGVDEADDGRRRRAEYSTDASNYRVVPEVVAFPRSRDEVEAVVQVGRELGVPITARGGGTSVAGNAVGTGIVMDLSRHMGRVLAVDPEARTAVVEPGALLASIQRAALPHGLRFGPDPSTWARCTIGGMIGNNACGPRALAFGRTADNVHSLDVIDGRGRTFTAARGLDTVPGLAPLVDRHLDILRTELSSFGRRISGYSLEHLLPENGRDLAKALVGTEGTVAAVLEATVRLVEQPVEPVLVVLGYPDMPSAADAVPALLPHRAMAIEGLDARIVDAVRSIRGTIPELPPGAGWLLVEVADQEPALALERAARLAADAGTAAVRILPAGPEARAVWRIREDGAGLAGRTPAGHQAWPGLEDAAVPPEHLGAYLREFEELTRHYGLTGMPYGHFGDGCVHVRLDLPLETDGTVLHAFMSEAAQLIASHGGSLSGEHGDGRARSELLGYMYSERMRGLFGAFKELFDPQDVLNPGIVVAPRPLDADLRRPAALPIRAVGGMAFRHDDGDITAAVHRCVGVGKCRADTSASGGFMCPSYLATRDERDSTRGRARVLQETINGGLITGGWRSPELHDALDLCLSCKACSLDCPAGVDMAALKSETLHRTYRRRLRPISHYTLGWMPRWARLATRVSALANAALRIRQIEKFVLFAGGMDTRRSIPRFARKPFRAIARKLKRTPGTGQQVLLWVDTFSDNFSPAIAEAAVDLLESAGYRVLLSAESVCCGLTWITTGQLDGARRHLARLVETFEPYAREGVPIVALEPSCLAAVRSDLLELIPDDPAARMVSESALTLAELLTAPAPLGPGEAWNRPDLSGTRLIVQPHCHQHSVMGFEADERLLRELGAELEVLAGCCGLAGNFGMERGHYEVSVAVAENALLPALRADGGRSVLLADGLSCRTQAEQLGGVEAMHLAQLLAGQAC